MLDGNEQEEDGELSLNGSGDSDGTEDEGGTGINRLIRLGTHKHSADLDSGVELTSIVEGGRMSPNPYLSKRLSSSSTRQGSAGSGKGSTVTPEPSSTAEAAQLMREAEEARRRAEAEEEEEERRRTEALSFAKRTVSLQSKRSSSSPSDKHRGSSSSSSSSTHHTPDSGRAAEAAEVRAATEAAEAAQQAARVARMALEARETEEEEKRRRAEAAEGASYEAAQHSSYEASTEGGKSEEDGKDESHDEWTIHLDEATGYMYRYNCRTGETIWCIENVDPFARVAQVEGGGSTGNAPVVDAAEQGGTDDTDDLAMARSRLRIVLANGAGEDADCAHRAKYVKL